MYNVRVAQHQDIESILVLQEEDCIKQNRIFLATREEKLLEESISYDEGLAPLVVEGEEGIDACCVFVNAFRRCAHAEIALYFYEELTRQQRVEAARTLMGACFMELNLRKLNLRVVAGARLELYRVMGFSLEVVLREHLYTAGMYRDVCHLGISRESYVAGIPGSLETGPEYKIKAVEETELCPDIAPGKRITVGERVEICALSPEDATVLYQQSRDSDEENFAGMGAAGPAVYLNNERQLSWKNNYFTPGEKLIFGIKKKQGALIGTAAFINIDNSNRNLMVGISIYQNENRGKGYGREAMQLLTDFAFLELNMHRVYLGAFSFNGPAAKLYERIGYKIEGINKDFLYRNGRYYDEICFGLLKQEWLKARAYIS